MHGVQREIFMKKLILSFLALLFISAAIFADQDSFFTNEVSLGTGIPIYNESSSVARKDILSTSNYKRIVAGLTLDTNLNISASIKILLGAELFTDFLWNEGLYYNSLDYSFLGGIKFYPGVKGLNISITYVLGNRSDFMSQNEPATQFWGNGFRLAVQYDFLTDRVTKIKPILGGYYRFVPRGNYNTDHILSIYSGIRF